MFVIKLFVFKVVKSKFGVINSNIGVNR